MKVLKPLAYGALVVLPLLGFASMRATDVTPRVPRPAQAFRLRAQVPPRFRGATPDDVDARIMSFDRNHDGKVAKDELLERMQGLMDRDINHDGVLTPNEIALQSHDVRGPAIVRGFGSAGYGFDEESEDSMRTHVSGVLADLKLPQRAHDRARRVVNQFLDARVQHASGTRQQDLARTAITEPRVAFANASEGPRPSVAKVHGAVFVTRLQAQSGLAETERLALAGELRGVLDDEQCADFLAAIARRPIRKFGFQPPRTVASGSELLHPNATVVVRP